MLLKKKVKRAQMRTCVVELAGRIVAREAAYSGAKKPDAMRVVAQHMGLSASTLANLFAGKIKDTRGRIELAVRAYFLRQLEAEIARLTHELEVVRLGALRPDDDAIFAAEAALATARRLIGGGGADGNFGRSGASGA